MMRKWNYFVAAALFAGFFLLRGGARPWRYSWESRVLAFPVA